MAPFLIAREFKHTGVLAFKDEVSVKIEAEKLFIACGKSHLFWQRGISS